MSDISINLILFVKDSIKYALKRAHLDERYEMIMTESNKIPAALKKAMKDSVNASYWSGKDSYFFCFRCDEVDAVREDDNVKISSMFKSGFYLSENTDFSSSDVYKGTINNKDGSPKQIYFVVKTTLH